MLEKYYVYIFLNGTYQRCALLSYDSSVYRLAYGIQYLQREDAVPIDPLNLPLYEKTFESESVFGALKDSSPDVIYHFILTHFSYYLPTKATAHIKRGRLTPPQPYQHFFL